MKTNQQAMRSVWHSLLWKEWHEHKWKLVSLTAMLLAVASLFRNDVATIDSSGVALTSLLIPYSLLAGVFLGMSTAGRESGRGTLPFLQSLPAPMWKPGISKLGVAIFAAVLPVLVFVGVVYFWRLGGGENLETTNFNGKSWQITELLLAITTASALSVSSLLLWVATAGGNRSDEICAGAIGFLVISSVWLALGLSANQVDKLHLETLEHGVELLIAAAPGGAVVAWQNKSENEYWYLLLVATGVISHSFVLAWYLRRFGKVVTRPNRFGGNVSALTLSKNQQLGPPMRSQFTAIAWKQIRETGPLALMALGGIIAITTVAWFFDKEGADVREIGVLLGSITLSVCFFVTFVTGIGVFFEDLKPGVDDFWRSKPVNYSLWFGVKFVVGASVLVAAFGTLMLLANWLSGSVLISREPHPLVQVATLGLIFLWIYTLAMATYCLLRQPIYAACLTFGLLCSGVYVISWIDNYLLRGFDLHWSVWLVSMLFFQVCATVVAWRAVRNDWGWKG